MTREALVYIGSATDVKFTEDVVQLEKYEVAGGLLDPVDFNKIE